VRQLTDDTTAEGRGPVARPGGLGAERHRQHPRGDRCRRAVDDPPGVWAAWCALRVGPAAVPANSVITVLPSTSAPASCAVATHEASARVNSRRRPPIRARSVDRRCR
jgi:hypothetical protein